MNIIGENFPSEIVKQINVRQEKKGAKNRTTENLVWQNANTGWVKMISSVDVNPNKRKMPVDSSFGESDIASRYVLFGGTSIQNFETGGLRLRGKLNSSENFTDGKGDYLANYGLGGLDLGLRPMPGITSFSIKSENRGSLRTATIGIKCYNKNQFDIINTLYLSLGYSVLIEWGNAMYYNNDGTFEKNNPYTFSDSFLKDKGDGYGPWLGGIKKTQLESYGNWDAALGKVVNFNWTVNRDLSYDIVVTVRTVGDVIESLKMNALSGYINIDLSGTQQFLQQVATGVTQSKLTSFYNLVIGKKTFVKELYDYMISKGLDDNKARGLLANALRESKLDPGSQIKDASNRLTNGGLFHWNGPRFDKLANKVSDWKTNWKAQIDYALTEEYGPIWSTATFATAEEAANSWLINWEKPQNPTLARNVNEEFLKLFPVGADYSNVTSPPTVGLTSVSPNNSSTSQPAAQNSATVISKYACTHDIGSLFYRLMLELENSPTVTDGSSVEAVKISFNNNANDDQYYIRFGYFLQELEKNIIYQLKDSDEKIIKFDYDVNDNIILLYSRQLSANPASCIFKRKYNLSDGTSITLFPELNDFVLDGSHSCIYGKIMNTYFSMRGILEQMDTLKNSNTGILTLIDLLKIFTRGFCNSTGNYNKIEPTVDQETNTIRITDEVRLPEADKIFPNQSNDVAMFRMFGYWQRPNPNPDKPDPNISEASIVRDLSLTTTVSPKLATMLTIGAQANGYITGQDSTALSVMNYGLTDRVKPEWVEPSSTITYPAPPALPAPPSTPPPGTTTTNPLAANQSTILPIPGFKFLNFNQTPNQTNQTQTTTPTPTPPAPTGPPTLEDKYKETLVAFNRFIQEMANNQWNQGDITAFSNSIQSFAEYDQAEVTLKQRQSNAGISSPNIGFLPFDLTLTIDGLSGMKIYQRFEVDTDFLPSNYPQSLEFIIKGITHEIKDNQWITKLESLAIPRSPFSTTRDFDLGTPRVAERSSNFSPSLASVSPTSFTGASTSTACGTTVIQNLNAPIITQTKIDAVKKAFNSVFANGDGPKSMCGRWTYNLAYNFAGALKGKPLSKGAQNGNGNHADSSTYRNNLKKLGYTEILWGQNVTKDKLVDLLSNNKGVFAPGDVVIYFSKNSKINRHTQMFVGDYGRPGFTWASNKSRNPGGRDFVYPFTNQNCFTLYLFRAPDVASSSAPTNTAGKSVTIGDSISVGIGNAFPNIKRIASLSQSGKKAAWLSGELEKTNPYPDVKNLVLSIGSNNLWDASNSDNKIINEIQRVFPNADNLYIINGNYGWGGLSLAYNIASVWEFKIKEYINVYTKAGFKVAGDISFTTVHPTPGDDLFNSFKQQLLRL